MSGTDVFTIIFMIVLVAGSYMLIRNEAVYRFRIRNGEEWYQRCIKRLAVGDFTCEPHPNDQMPTYNTMMAKFWVWPLSRFYKGSET